jgi:hypothetical protein
MMRLWVLELTCIALIAAAVMGCGRSTNSGAPTQDAPGAARITFDFDPEISTEDRALIETTIAESRSFFARELGRDLKLDITVKVSAEDGGAYLGLSYGRTAWIFTGGESWPSISTVDDVWIKERVVAHELFHNFQWDLMYSDDALPSRSAWWLLEGSAEYAAAKFISDRHNLNWGLLVFEYFLSTERGLPSLNAETRDVEYFNQLYPKAFLALETLMRNRPLKVLATYFEATGRTDWKEVFQQTFGVEPSDFVDNFEADYQ